MSDLDDFRHAKNRWLKNDPRSPLVPAHRRGFPGLPYYAEAPDLVFVVTPEVFAAADLVELPTSAGETATYERWARVRFDVEGEPAELTVYRQPGDGQFFLPFVDAGAGGETYGAGRYLEVHELEDGRLLIDFNYAYNPYCAYNEGYSCPIPPAENRLPVAIRAGERAYEGVPAEHRHQPVSKPIEAVIFDWGGTLADYAAIELVDMWRIAAHHLAGHMAVAEEAILERLTAVEVRMWERTTTDARSASLSDLLAEATRELGVDVTEAVLEEACTHYLDSWTPHIVHDAEAVATLTALRERGLRIGLLSNTHWPPAYHERFLERDGLDGLIDARLYTSEMPFMKPHPEAFRRALEAVGVEDAARAVFVGDRLFDDIHGAQRAGMRTVHRVNPSVPPYDVRPDATIERLSELVPIVEGWMREGSAG